MKKVIVTLRRPGKTDVELVPIVFDPAQISSVVSAQSWLAQALDYHLFANSEFFESANIRVSWINDGEGGG